MGTLNDLMRQKCAMLLEKENEFLPQTQIF